MFGEDTNPRDPSGFNLARPLDMDRAYDSLSVGWMYRTNEMTAALARSQLARLAHANERARANGAVLGQALAALPGVTPPQVPEDRVTCWHKYRVMFDASAVGVNAPAKRVRTALLAGLRAEGVDTVLWQTQPIPGQKVFRDRVGFGKGYPWSLGGEVDYDPAHFPVTQRVLDHSLCLFSQSFPLAPQPLALVEQYAHAFAKVWSNLAELVEKTLG
jgi:dTDP-4-amino-4,6-dideoxygalactose transaminase